MPTIRITAPLDAVPFKRVMTNGKRRFNDAKYTEFKKELGYFAFQAMQGREPMTGAIKISVDVYKNIIPTALKFGDWDNHGKAVSDALNGICYKDDKQIVEGHIRLFKGEPQIIITLEAIE